MRGRRRLCIAAAGVWAGLSIFGDASVRAGAQAPLDPNAFASLGTANGTAAFDTTNVTVSINGGTPIPGVVFNGVAVFDFDSVNISADVVSTAMGPAGALPLAILSRGAVVMNGSINVGASLDASYPFGSIGGPGAGSGSSFGGQGPGASTQVRDGAGFGGKGGAGGPPGPIHLYGGPAYGDPTHAFQGGSGGSGGGGGGIGGGGGGALEISALGDILIGGQGIVADGGFGLSSQFAGGGGGSGGGLLIATPGQITLNSLLSANGGPGGSSTVADTQGGGGGGGRILLETSNFVQGSGSSITVSGGSAGLSGLAGGNSGDPGTFDVTSYVPAVPEPGIGSGLLIGIGAMLTRRRAV